MKITYHTPSAQTVVTSAVGLVKGDTGSLSPAQEALVSDAIAARDAVIGYETRAEAAAANVPSVVKTLRIGALAYRRDASGTALTTADGHKWSPLPPYHLSHWTEYRGEAGDLSTELQEAHDWIGENGGGTLQLGEGVIPIGQTVYVGDTPFPVLIAGKGRGISILADAISVRQSAATRIAWTGAAGGNCLILTGNRNDDGTKPRASGGGIVDVFIDGKDIGGRGLQVISHNDHHIVVHLGWWKNVMFYSDVLHNGIAGGPADNQGFIWNIMTSEVGAAVEADAHFAFHGKIAHNSDTGVPLAGANTSLGYIQLLHSSVEKNGVGGHFGNCDGLTISAIRVARRDKTGSGGQVYLHGTNTFPAVIGTIQNKCRYVTILSGQCDKLIAENGSGPNHAVSLSVDNGAALPEIIGNGQLSWADRSGRAALTEISGTAVQSSATDNTAGRVLKITSNQGTFGLGGLTPPTIADLDVGSTPSGFYRVNDPDTIGTFPNGAVRFGNVTVYRYDGNVCHQEYRPVGVATVYRRYRYGGVWSTWV